MTVLPSETLSVQKRKDRSRLWLNNGPWLLFLLVGCSLAYWYFNRESNTVTLKYGELIQILQAAKNNPAVSVQKVDVGHSDIRGEIVSTDPVTDGDKNTRPPVV